MKKLFVLAFAVLALCLVFSACGADPDDPTKDGMRGNDTVDDKPMYDYAKDYTKDHADEDIDEIKSEGNAVKNRIMSLNNETGGNAMNYDNGYSPESAKENNEISRGSYDTGRDIVRSMS